MLNLNFFIGSIPSITTSGGVVLGGSSHNIYNETSNGGIVLGGASTLNIDYNETSNGGIVLGGTSLVTYSYNVNINDSGIVLGGKSPVSVTIDYSKHFTWEVNSGVSYWWRVESDCVILRCPPISMNDSCSNVPRYTGLTYINATDCIDLVNKLNERNWVWPIKSVKRYTLPLFTSDIPPNIDANCNPILDVDFTHCVITSEALSVQEEIEFNANLDIELLINAETVNSYDFTSSGIINLNGSNEVNYSSTEIVEFTKNLSMELVEISLTNTINSLALKKDTSTITLSCCSNPLPRILYLKHNLQFANDLYQFAMHNNIKIPGTIPLYYSNKTKIWQGNLSYQGLNYQNNELQNWSLLFEFGWVTQIGPTDLGGGVWKFLMYIVEHKPNAINYPSTHNTKFTTYFDNNLFTQSSPVGFKFTYNTQNKKLDPSNIIDLIFTDKVGLFKSKYWLANPLLRFGIQKEEFYQTDKFTKYPEITLPIDKVRIGIR